MENIYIIGQAGFGKTPLLHKQFLGDIYNGFGVLFIDPDGTDIDALMPYIPRDRLTDTILFDPSDTDHPIAWDMLSINSHHVTIVSAVEAAIRDTVTYSSATPQMSMFIRCVVLVLLKAKEPITGMSYMLTSVKYRDKVMAKVQDPVMKHFWRRFEAYNTKDKDQLTASTFNKTLSMVLDDRLRNVLGQRNSAFTMADVLEGKILLARLPRGQLGYEQVRMLGIMLLSQFNQTALASPSKLLTRIYIRSVHTVAGGVLSNMLTTLNKYNVGITMVNEDLGQFASIDAMAKTSILGNTGKKYVFRVSIKDDEELNEKRGIAGWSNTLYDLQKNTAVLMGGPKIESADCKPHDYPCDEAMTDAIRQHTRRHYSRPAAQVAAEIDAFIREA